MYTYIFNEGINEGISQTKKNYILDVGKKIYNETNSIIKANII